MTRVAVTTLTIGGSRKVDGMAAWVREGVRRLNEDRDQFPAQRRQRGRGTIAGENSKPPAPLCKPSRASTGKRASAKATQARHRFAAGNHPASTTRRRGGVRSSVQTAQPTRLCPMLAHGRRRRGSRGSNTGSVPAAISKDTHIPGGIRVFFLAAPAHCQYRAHALPQE